MYVSKVRGKLKVAVVVILITTFSWFTNSPIKREILSLYPSGLRKRKNEEKGTKQFINTHKSTNKFKQYIWKGHIVVVYFCSPDITQNDDIIRYVYVTTHNIITMVAIVARFSFWKFWLTHKLYIFTYIYTLLYNIYTF